MNLKIWGGHIIYKWVGDLPELLVQDSRSLNPKYSQYPAKTRFPGGMQELEDKGNLLMTADREVAQETFLRRKSEPEPIIVYNEIRGYAQKVFFLIPFYSMTGNLRRSSLVDGDSFIFPPRFESADKLDSMLYGVHKVAFRRAIRVLAKQRSKTSLVE